MFYPALLVVADFIAILAAFTIAYIVRVDIDTRPVANDIQAFSFIDVFFLLIPIWLVIHALLGLYHKNTYEKRLAEFSKLFVGSFIGILLIIGFDFVSDEPIFPARIIAVYGFVLAFLLLLIGRNALWLLRRLAFRYGYGLRTVALIGNTEATKELARIYRDSKSSGYNVQLIVGGEMAVPDGFSGKVVKTLDKGLELMSDLGVNTIIQTEFFEKEEKNRKILIAARENHLSYRFIPAQSEFFSGKNTVEVFNGYPLVGVHQTPLIGWGQVVKRIFDIVVSAILLIFALPVMLFFGIIIKLSDPKGPIIFRHKRITRYGTPFEIFKLRSMYIQYSSGPKKSDLEIFKAMGREDLIEEFKENQKVKKDPRIMPIGRFIRATSIDELPQLINVLKGELSLVGPRAIVEDELKKYKKHNSGGLVTSVKSGITGLWQVSGRSNISYDERIMLDKYYVQNWSFWLDIKILIKTVKVVFTKSGAE